MTDKAIITLGDTKLEAPIIVGHRGRARHRHRAAPREDGVRDARPRVHEHGVDQERHHVHRRRQGHPALPRHPHRAARREVDVRRDGVPPHLRATSRTRRSSRSGASKLTRHSLLHEDMKHFFEGFPATAHPMAILSAMVVGAVELLPGRARRRTTSTSATSPSRAWCRRCGPSRPSRTRSRSGSRSSIRRTRSRTARTSST